MNNKDRRKAIEYFVEKYGEDYADRSYAWSFGYSTLPRVVRYSPDLSSDAKICYSTLTDMMNNTEETIPWGYFPSQKRIALLSGMRRQVVNKSMRELEKAGLVGSKRQGLGKQNIYCLLAPPAKFIDSALQARAIVNLIRRDEMSWDDVSDNGEVNDTALLAKIGAEKSMVTPDVRNNGQQEVFQENADQLSEDTTDGDNSEKLLEVNSETQLQPTSPQGATPISEKQELTSVEVTSDNITSVTTNPPIREKDAQIGKSDGGDFLDGVQNNSDSGDSDADNSIHSETDKIGGDENGSNRSSDSNVSSDNHLVPDGNIDDGRLTYIQGVVDYFNWLYIKYNDKISQRTTRPAKLQSVDKYAKGKYRAALGWYNQGIPLDRICEVLDVWVGAHTDSPVPLNYFANHEVPVELAEIDPEALAYVKEYFKEE